MSISKGFVVKFELPDGYVDDLALFSTKKQAVSFCKSVQYILLAENTHDVIVWVERIKNEE